MLARVIHRVLEITLHQLWLKRLENKKQNVRIAVTPTANMFIKASSVNFNCTGSFAILRFTWGGQPQLVTHFTLILVIAIYIRSKLGHLQWLQQLTHLWAHKHIRKYQYINETFEKCRIDTAVPFETTNKIIERYHWPYFIIAFF